MVVMKKKSLKILTPNLTSTHLTSLVLLTVLLPFQLVSLPSPLSLSLRINAYYALSFTRHKVSQIWQILKVLRLKKYIILKF